MKKIFLSIAALLAALPAFAQQSLLLDIHDGREPLRCLRSRAADPRRMGQVGGTQVVGADKIAGTLFTLRLVNIPERQALDIILRGVAGYMAAPRLASAAPGARPTTAS